MLNLGGEGVDMLSTIRGYVGRVGQKRGIIVCVDFELGACNELRVGGTEEGQIVLAHCSLSDSCRRCAMGGRLGDDQMDGVGVKVDRGGR